MEGLDAWFMVTDAKTVHTVEKNELLMGDFA